MVATYNGYKKWQRKLLYKARVYLVPLNINPLVAMQLIVLCIKKHRKQKYQNYKQRLKKKKKKLHSKNYNLHFEIIQTQSLEATLNQFQHPLSLFQPENITPLIKHKQKIAWIKKVMW